jgi:hypothetical protein
VELLNRYKKEIETDLIINDFNIKEVQQKLPARKHFWAGRLIDSKVEQQQLIKQKKIIKNELVKRINNEAVVKLSAQSIEIAAEQTDEITKITEKIKEYDCIIEYLEKVEKIMSNMHWDIRNIVEIQKMEQL